MVRILVHVDKIQSYISWTTFIQVNLFIQLYLFQILSNKLVYMIAFLSQCKPLQSFSVSTRDSIALSKIALKFILLFTHELARSEDTQASVKHTKVA